MTGLHNLFAKIRSLSKRRIAEVDNFVDFLSRRGSVRRVKLPLTFEEQMTATEMGDPARHGRSAFSGT